MRGRAWSATHFPPPEVAGTGSFELPIFKKGNRMKHSAAWLSIACPLVLLACSDPDHGPPLGTFAAINKTETDPPFNIVPPASRSPAPFTYSSSNPAVAVVAGSLLTIKGVGQSTITASQAAVGGWGPTSASTTLNVGAVSCGGNQARIDGVCTACVAPATALANECRPPAADAKPVTALFLAWTGVGFTNAWSLARDYCATITVEGRRGWKLPNAEQLLELQASGALAGQNWALGPTWSATPGTSTASHVAVDLAGGGAAERADADLAYVTCVR